MSTEEWTIVVGVATAGLLAFGPWALMVHAKLAVIANQIITLCDKLQQAAERTERLWALYLQHEARLDNHDVQLTHMAERLREIE